MHTRTWLTGESVRCLEELEGTLLAKGFAGEFASFPLFLGLTWPLCPSRICVLHVFKVSVRWNRDFRKTLVQAGQERELEVFT